MKYLTTTFLLFFLMSSLAFSQDWQTDFEQAKTLATQENKNIILVFQGSDWCAPCIKLDREIWSTEEFKNYAAKHFVMLQADFPKKKKNALPVELQNANALLAEAYNKNGIFPLVVIMDNRGKVLGQTSYKKMSPSDYIKLLASFKA
ncbi:thioredoxin family protein [Muriicola sp. Z0-33]|uniref:thioredoxin family protein n=1 Tax=Muriicola sp. Z0-33 TaxID=2816957 RepID=UPI002238BD44|nr:thioredoxin family protein [Muriicola sp. Z0-33]MCW5515497.1 thioredoxin family protein [Muriicola sp. Z0-33]